MKRGLILILAGLLTLGTQAQQTNNLVKNPEIVAKKRAEEVQKRKLAQMEAEYFESAADGYLKSANNKYEMAINYLSSVDQIARGIENLTETNYPAAWIKVGDKKREVGRLEKQIGNNLLRAGDCLDKAYLAWKVLGQDRVSIKNRRESLANYLVYFNLSRESYETAKKYFIEAKDIDRADKVTELMASEDEQTATIYSTIRKGN